jgi:hypothetical protein
MESSERGRLDFYSLENPIVGRGRRAICQSDHADAHAWANVPKLDDFPWGRRSSVEASGGLGH